MKRISLSFAFAFIFALSVTVFADQAPEGEKP